MPLITLEKDKIVAEDLALGIDDVPQERGVGKAINASIIPYNSTETILDAVEKKEDSNAIDGKLALKADIQGSELVRFKTANAVLDDEAINKGQLDSAIVPLATTNSVDIKLAGKAAVNGNVNNVFNISPGFQPNHAITKNQLDSAIAPLESTINVDSKLAGKAEVAGNEDNTFDVKEGVTNKNAVNKGQVDTALSAKSDITYVDTELSTKANSLDVLFLDGSSPTFSPTSDNQPATKKYADDLLIAVGAGDMAKSTYDTNDSGIVDSTEAIGKAGTFLGKTPMEQVMRLAQSNASDANLLDDFGLFVGTNIANAPISGQLIISQFSISGGTNKYQIAYDLHTPDIYSRAYNGTIWTAWQKNARVEDVVSLTGDTMSGNLNLLNDISLKGYTTAAAIKNLIRVSSSDKIEIGEVGLPVEPKGSWNFTESLTIPTPTVATNPARKDYVDAKTTDAEILSAVKRVDGSGSGLDADLVQGVNGLYLRGLSSGGNTIDPNTTTIEYIMTTHANVPNGEGYWHIRTQYYSTITSSSNCAQIAISYNSIARAYIRYRYANNWSDWILLTNVYNNASDLLTAIKTVDGSGSGLDADLLDGLSSASFVRTNNKQALSTASNALTISGQNITLARGDGSTDVVAIPVAEGTPSGTVITTARSSAPSGYLKCNGAAISRTTYASLYAAIGTRYGAGNGSTTFNVPDLRGEFVRGFDDGRGVDSGRVLGSAQSDEFESHKHIDGARISAATKAWNGTASVPSGDRLTGDASNITIAGYTSSVGGSETRPRNIALLYCIKT